MSKIRVGFLVGQLTGLGGINYFRNLFAAIQSLPEVNVRAVVISGFKSDLNAYEGLAEIIRTSILDRYTFGWWVSRFLARIFPRRDYLLYFILLYHRVNLISHKCLFWKGCSIPSIGWIPDFQHQHLPNFFDETKCKLRDKQFNDILERCNAVILSSQDALNDLNKFYNNKIPSHILRFVSSPDINSHEMPGYNDLVAKYDIDRPWFYIPNQFWAHKNHSVVVEALYSLKGKGNEFLVIASGCESDNRNENYFPTLMKKVDSYGLQDDFRSLGVIPYSDVVALMYYSIAVINPSLFEGWSTSVEESKSLGKMIILSNITVHQEQNPDRGCFFDPKDKDMLADKMIAVVKQYDKEKEAGYYKKAQAEYIVKRKNIAKQFEEICLQVALSKRN